MHLWGGGALSCPELVQEWRLRNNFHEFLLMRIMLYYSYLLDYSESCWFILTGFDQVCTSFDPVLTLTTADHITRFSRFSAN